MRGPTSVDGRLAPNVSALVGLGGTLTAGRARARFIRTSRQAGRSNVPGLVCVAFQLSVRSDVARASEVVALKVTDVDSERMTLRIEQGKGRRDRYAML